MKLSKASIAVIIIGVVLVTMAPLWKWVITPQFIKIPDNIDIKSEYRGTLELFADPDKLEIYPEGQSTKIDLKVTRTTVSVPEKSSSKTALIKETVVAKDLSGETIIEWTKYFALDRKTAKNVPGNNSDMDRLGYYVMLPMGTEKIGYDMWDDDVETTGMVEFAGTEKRDGGKHKGLKVYVFTIDGPVDPMVAPPLGLPSELSGAQIKQILNQPDIALPDDAMLPIEYYKSTDATFAAEPRTGSIIDITEYHEEYFANAALPGEPANYIKLAILDYKQTKESVRIVADDTAKYFGLLDLVTLWLPLIFLVVGLIAILFGFFPGRKDKREPVEKVPESGYEAD